MATYWEIAAHLAYDMFSWYRYLLVNLVFSHLGFWSGNLFLIAPFPDLCLLVPSFVQSCSCHLVESDVSDKIFLYKQSKTLLLVDVSSAYVKVRAT